MGFNADSGMMYYTLITGASKGIGKALAEEFAEEGHNLILTARSAEELEDVAALIRKAYNVNVQVFPLDLLAKDAVETLYAWCVSNQYTVQILVNNAGIGFYGNFEEVSLKDYMDMLYLNQSVLLAMCYTFLPMLKAAPKSHILNISSISANIPSPYMAAYAATKSFVLQFTRGLRHELIKTNINVSCSCPGITDTNFYERGGFQQKKDELKNMQKDPRFVAEVSVDGLLRGQAVIVPGFTNKVGVYLSRLIPDGLLTGLVSFVLKPKKNARKTN